MRESLKLLMECDGIAVLDDWECSAGARLEVHIAGALMMPVKPIVKWGRLA
jgi:hypothetical protein